MQTDVKKIQLVHRLRHAARRRDTPRAKEILSQLDVSADEAISLLKSIHASRYDIADFTFTINAK
jgi:hypothetical protein